MLAYLIDYGNLLLRWLHVIAAIAWIGESIYFVMLDNSLRPPRSAEGKKRGVFGEMWAVHGGGFYHNQKYLTNPAELPDDLHWSFWKAYTTWLSGFALFTTMYLLRPDFYLVHRASDWAWAANLGGWQAAGLAVVFLLVGWVIYDQLCRRISPNMERDGLLSVAVAIMMVILAWLSCQVFPGRAAFLITGAVMATCMSANVFFWIIPGQRRMVHALKNGQAPNPLDGKRGKQRSVHNTYFTLPVVLLMLSNHYSFTYTHPQAWVIMSLFIFAGALIRQYFVLLHTGRNAWGYPVAGVVLLVVIGWMGAPATRPAPTPVSTLQPAQPAGTETTPQAAAPVAAADGVSLQQVMHIMQARCVQCHAIEPTFVGMPSAPAGVSLETEQDVLANPALLKQVIENGYMPLGNLTDMTDDERAVIAAWAVP